MRPRSRPTDRHALARIAAILLASAGLAALAALGWARDEPPRPAAQVSAAGPLFDHANSRAGMPVLTAADLAPGRSASGAVTLTNVGEVAATFALTVADLADADGPAGLGDALRLRVAADGSGTLYDGPLAAAEAVPVGSIDPGQARTYQLTARLPDSAPAELAGGGASFRLVWDATGDEGPDASRPPDPLPVPTSRPPSGRQASSPPAEPAPPRFSLVPRPLRLRVWAPRTQRVAGRGRLELRARCDWPCRIVLRGRLRVDRRRAALRGWRARRVRAGTTRPRVGVPRRLRPALARALAKGRRPAGRYLLRVSARDRHGRRVARRVAVTLSPLPRRPGLARVRVVARRAAR